MAVAAFGQLNLDESPLWGSRSIECFEKLEQIGEGTYGLEIYIPFILYFGSYLDSYCFISLCYFLNIRQGWFSLFNNLNVDGLLFLPH